MEKQFLKILKLIHLSEKLKSELRHSWLSNGRQESVAEHTWRMSLMAILLSPYLEKPVNIEKTLKIIIIHDLVEAETKDIPAFMKRKQKEKRKNEEIAIRNIKSLLDNKTGQEIYNLWQEFEVEKSYEAKFAKALDKMEVRIQHNEAKIDTWEKIEFPRSLFAADKYCEFDRTIKSFNEIVKTESLKKMKKTGINIEEVKAKVNKMRFK